MYNVCGKYRRSVPDTGIAVKLLVFLAVGGALLFVSCAKNPLTGFWADSFGNSLRLSADLHFALATKSEDQTDEYSGTYTAMHNVLVFAVSDGRQLVAEWDIRGNIMYVTAPVASEGGDSLKLVLFKTGE